MTKLKFVLVLVVLLFGFIAPVFVLTLNYDQSLKAIFEGPF